MASKQTNVDFVLEQMADAGAVSARKMFGEYAIYCRNKIVALFCDDQLFVKPTTAGRTFIGKVKEGAPYPGAKPWFLISGDRCEDGEWLAQLIVQTERELPPPKPKAPKRKVAKKPASEPKTPRRAAGPKTREKTDKKQARKR
jgi:DNA transformation protein